MARPSSDGTRSPAPSSPPPAWSSSGARRRTRPEVVAAGAQGNRVIMSPADRAYLDMSYDESSPLGLSWAGHIGSGRRTSGIRSPTCRGWTRRPSSASRRRCGPRRRRPWPTWSTWPCPGWPPSPRWAGRARATGTGSGRGCGAGRVLGRPRRRLLPQPRGLAGRLATAGESANEGRPRVHKGHTTGPRSPGRQPPISALRSNTSPAAGAVTVTGTLYSLNWMLVPELSSMDSGTGSPVVAT